MQVSHTPAAVSAVFDDPNLVAYAGLVPVMRLAERCGLSDLAAAKVKLTGAGNGAGAAADAKVTSIVAGMAAGADSIDDLNVLRHGAMPAVFAGVRAPSTLGTFLRSFTHGHALQLHAVHRRFLTALAAHTPLLPGAGEGVHRCRLHPQTCLRPGQTGRRVRPVQGHPNPAPPARHGLHPRVPAGDRRGPDATRQSSRLQRRPEIRE
jgi:hypothetical protein